MENLHTKQQACSSKAAYKSNHIKGRLLNSQHALMVTIAFFFMLILAVPVSGQLVGTKNIPGNYATLADAITDLNTQGVGAGGVTLNLIAGNPQTAPAGGYVIGGAGSLVLTTSSMANPVILQGNANTLTAPAPQTSGLLTDAVIKLIGADWVTISGFTLSENAANLNTTAGTNDMTEWGIALLYVTTTDGSQNNTIRNNTIDLNRTYQNTFGIYANATHSATAPTTGATATTTAGGNSGLKIYSNSITDINIGIVVVGPTAAADNTDGLEIGGPGNGNIITNYGTTGTFTGYINVSGSVNGVLVRNVKNYTISDNTLTSSVGGTTSGTLRGIYVPSFSNAPTGTITNQINNNNISLKSGSATAAMQGVIVESATGNATTILNINANDFNNTTHTLASSGGITFISHGMAILNSSISNNTFTNLSVNTTGSITFISNSWSLAANGTKQVNNNAIVTGFTKTGAGGSIVFFTDNGSDPLTGINNVNNNTFSNISVTGSTTVSGIVNTNGGSPIKSVSNNQINNISGGTGSITGISIDWDGGTATVLNNTISGISAAASITGISFGSNGTGTTNVSQNTIHTLSGTATGAVIGVVVAGSTTTKNLFRNKIYNLENSNAAGSVNGITVPSGLSINIYNNVIGDLRTPAVSAVNSLNGINITSATSSSAVNVSFNTIYLNATSSGANFGSSGISHTASVTSTTATLNLRNNIIVNLSTSNGTGVTTALRRSAVTLGNYGAASNRNLFYTGTPTATRTIFYDGVTPYQTLPDFKTLVSPRDANSVTENPPFISTTGANANFLHISNVIATQIESGAVNIAGITTDFDSEIRQGNGGYTGLGTAPDIGADEGDFVIADFAGPGISYTPLSFTCSTGNRLLSGVMITDGTGVPTTGSNQPRIYYRKAPAGPWSSSQGTLVSGSATNGSWDFNIIAADMGGLVTSDIVHYYVIAQDVAVPHNISANPGAGLAATDVNTVTTPPTTPNNYSINLILSGTYLVGAGQTFTTLTQAVNAYNASCLSGPVVFEMTDLTYPGETFPIVVNSNADASAVNTLTIHPTGGIAVVVSGSGAPALFDLNGADYVTLNGLNSGGNSMTFRNTSTTGATIRMIGDASNNSVQNMTFEGVVTSTTLGVVTLSTGTTTGNDNNTINSNVIRDRSDVAGVPVNLIYSSGSSSTVTNTGNVITGNTIKNNTGISILITGTGASNGNENWTITNNTIFQEAARTSTLIGISFSSLGANTISQNIIRDLNTSAATTGILLLDARNTTVSRNRIYNIPSTSGSTSALAGIQFNGFTGFPASVTVHNNMVSIVPSFANAQAIRGIYDFAFTGNTFNAFYNSILVGGTGTGSSNTWALVRGSLAPTDYTARNNIALNARTGGTGNHYGGGDGSGAGGTFVSNHNIFVGTGAVAANLMEYNGTAVSSSNWQTGPPSRDANSQFSNPAGSYTQTAIYTSATDLHAVTSGNPASNSGTPVAITTDFDNELRDAVTPDNGADEFAALIGEDVGAVSLAAPLSGVCYTNAETVTVTIQNFGIAMIDFAINNVTVNVSTTGPVVYSSSALLNSGTLAAGATMNVNMPASINMTANGTYVFTLSTTLTGDINNANDMTVVNRNGATLGGSYTVGVGEDFATLTAAITFYNAATCFTGPVVYELTDLSYSASETFPLTIIDNLLAGTTTLTIRPASGIQSVVSGSNSTALFNFNGADYVTLDGVNTGGSSLLIRNTTTGPTIRFIADASNNTIQNMTVEGMANASSSGVIMLSTGTTTGNDNNTFSNNLIRDRSDASGLPSNLIYASGTSNTIANSNIVISNNTLKNFSVTGIITAGAGSTIGNDNWTITGNTIFQEAARTSSIGGISFSGLGTNTISQNIIRDLTSSLSIACIFLTDARNTTVSGNRIYNISGSSGSTSELTGIYFVGSNGNTPTVTIYNNMVSMVPAFTNTQIVRGIYDFGWSGNTFSAFYNSIYIGGTGSGSSSTYAFVRGSGAPTNFTARNNIALNTRTGGTGNHFGGGDNSGGDGTYDSDYNIYVGTGSTAANFMEYDAVAVSSASWQAGPPVRDPNSQFSNPGGSYTLAGLYLSATDLHAALDANPASNAGTPVSVLTDFDNEVRSVTTPDMGSDEFTVVACAGAEGGTSSGSASFCGSGTPVISASGYSVGTGSSYQWQSSTDFAFTTPVDIMDQINPAALSAGVVNTTTYYRLRVTCTTGTATDFSSIVTITINPLPAASASNDSPVCAGFSVNLMGTTDIGITYSWTGPNSFVSTSQNPTISNILVAGSGIYSFVATSAIGCPSNPATTTVTVNQVPGSIEITPSTVSRCQDDPAELLTASGGQIANAFLNASGPINIPIPDDVTIGLNEATHIIPVAGIPAGAIIDSMVVTINITHGWDSDLDITLEGPNANVEILSTDNGGSGDNYTNTRISSDPSKPLISGGTAPFTGTYKAEGDLTNLFSIPNGNWKLKVVDDESAFAGTLNNWSIKIYYKASGDFTWFVSPGVYTGLYTDPSATTPYTGTPSTTVYADPSSTITYTVEATVASCSNTNTVEVGVNGLIVENTNDSGKGSLRDVIMCAPSGSTITFAPGLTGQTIVLTSGEIDIDKNLTISGLGAVNLMISGNNNSRVFHLLTTFQLKIADVSLINGSSVANGGAILTEGTLILENVTLNNNLENGLPKGLTILNPGSLQIVGQVNIND